MNGPTIADVAAVYFLLGAVTGVGFLAGILDLVGRSRRREEYRKPRKVPVRDGTQRRRPVYDTGSHGLWEHEAAAADEAERDAWGQQQEPTVAYGLTLDEMARRVESGGVW